MVHKHESLHGRWHGDNVKCFCFARWDCDTVAKGIGDDALPYHADLTDNQRLETQRKWMGDKVKIICATIGESLLSVAIFAFPTIVQFMPPTLL